VVTAPYGSWASPISIDDLTAGAKLISAPRIDGDQIYWLETRPDQGGRTSIRRRELGGDEPIELTAAPAYVRTRVHEYGGGEYDVRDGVVVYSEFGDGRLYRMDHDGDPQPLTPQASFRYADLRVHPERGLVLAVREDHSQCGEPLNTIVALELDGPNESGGTVLCNGADFYSTPELSDNGQLAWTEWNHPNMPWDSTMIMVGRFDGAAVVDAVPAAGGPGESAVQPRWLSGDQLIFVSDRTGWWNLYLRRDRIDRPLCPMDAEFSGPQWSLGLSPYAVLDDDHLLCSMTRTGMPSIAMLTISNGTLVPVTEPAVGSLSVATGPGVGAAVLGYPNRPPTLAIFDVDQQTWCDVVAASPTVLEPDSVSCAQAVSWYGDQGEVHGWFYPPTNLEYEAPAGDLPPLLTLSHGGPTGTAVPYFQIGHQFWTSRGFAILDLNYGGSAGFGRAYRDRLIGQWGVADVRDCADGAQAMAEQGLADPARLIAKGASAGGYTTLRALTSTQVFSAGISLFGVADLEALAIETHKFESHYLDRLVGPYPEARNVYRERSPIDHADELSAPILLLQGLDDRVVPPDQAEAMANAARRKGLPVTLIMFEGEGHGFRSAGTIRVSTQAQIYFLSQIFGIEPADAVPPIKIENFLGGDR
jgi:dipeptidyl aminopeptidase/acylaminoacyl peptidase